MVVCKSLTESWIKILYVYIFENIFNNTSFIFFPCKIIGKLAFEDSVVLLNIGLNGQGQKYKSFPEFKLLNKISWCLLCLKNSYSNYIVISKYYNSGLSESWRFQIIIKLHVLLREQKRLIKKVLKHPVQAKWHPDAMNQQRLSFFELCTCFLNLFLIGE